MVEMANYIARSLCQDTAQDWDMFNDRAKDGSLFHSVKWITTLENSLGLKSYCFLIYLNEEPVALCPIFDRHMKGFRGLATLPESDLYYLIDNNTTNSELIDSIMQNINKIAKDQRSAFVLLSFSNPETRDGFTLKSATGRTMVSHNMNGYMSLDLNKFNPTAIWEKAFSSKYRQRWYIRRFEEEGYRTRETRSEEDLSRFYEQYAHNLAEKDVKPYGKSHFNYLLEKYSNKELRMTFLEKDGQMAAGLITLFHAAQKAVYFRYSFINKDPSNMNGYHRRAILPICWEAINHAFDHGYKQICFGGTPSDPLDPTHQIKAGFGCKYENIYSSIIQTSRLFSILYRSYNIIDKKRAE